MSGLALLDPPTLGGILAETRAALEVIYGDRLAALLLYGSYARGEARADSDVDVLAVLRGSVRPSYEIRRTSEALGDLSLRHDILLSCMFVSEDDFRNGDSPFLINVRREGVPA